MKLKAAADLAAEYALDFAQLWKGTLCRIAMETGRANIGYAGPA